MKTAVSAGAIACPGEDIYAGRLIPQDSPIGRGENWEWITDWRIVPDYPNYALSPDIDNLQVWRRAGKVPCRGGGMRQVSAKQLKLSKYGRVDLSHNGAKTTYHAERELYPLVYPDLVELQRQAKWQRQQRTCGCGHPLVECASTCIQPRIAYWGTYNRICLWCCGELPEFVKDTYSQHYGVNPWREYSLVPAEPKRRRFLSDDYDHDSYQASEFFSEFYGDNDEASGYLLMDARPSEEWYYGVSPEGADRTVI